MTAKNSPKPNQGLDNEAIESALLLGSDKCVQENLKRELEQELEKLSMPLPEKSVITDFSALDEDDVFSENTHYSLFNRNTKRLFFINGKDVERRLGVDEVLYDKVKSRKTDTFLVDNSIISFYKSVCG